MAIDGLGQKSLPDLPLADVEVTFGKIGNLSDVVVLLDGKPVARLATMKAVVESEVNKISVCTVTLDGYHVDIKQEEL